MYATIIQIKPSHSAKCSSRSSANIFCKYFFYIILRLPRDVRLVVRVITRPKTTDRSDDLLRQLSYITDGQQYLHVTVPVRQYLLVLSHTLQTSWIGWERFGRKWILLWERMRIRVDQPEDIWCSSTKPSWIKHHHVHQELSNSGARGTKRPTGIFAALTTSRISAKT